MNTTEEGLQLLLSAHAVAVLVDQVTARVLERLMADRKEHPSPYLTVCEAAEYLRCSRQRIYDLLSQRRLTRVKEGSRTLVSRDEIERHLKHQGSKAERGAIGLW
jgi:excisionase family DNA binding protein